MALTSCNCPKCQEDAILNGTLIAQCSSCKIELNKITQFQIVGDKNIVCLTCAKTYYEVCKCCGRNYKKSELVQVYRYDLTEEKYIKYTVCERCRTQLYRKCGQCDGYFEKNRIKTHNENIYCDKCFHKHYDICTHCGTIKDHGTLIYNIRGMKKVCDECYNNYGPIEVYETKPKLEFHGKPPYYYGIELEIELLNQKREERGKKAHLVSELFDKNFVVLKEDGSLRCGFEICTQPASLKEHYTKWEQFFNKIPEGLVSFNSPYKNCGLHVHCSKKPLSLLTIAKMVIFVNDENNRSMIETIAGRKSNQYFKIEKKNYGMVRQMNNFTRNDRYEAINLVNKNTIEFRMFKGTLKRESFFKAIEFCDSLTQFCMASNYGISQCRKWQNYIDYVTSKNNDYPHLYAFINAKFLKKETKLTKKYGFSVSIENNDSQL